MIGDCPEKMPCTLAFSQDEYSQPTQTCELGSSELVEEEALAISSLEYLPMGASSILIHGCLLWQTQGDPEGYGASLAPCLLALRRVSLTCLMQDSHKQCWKHLIYCLPRRLSR